MSTPVILAILWVFAATATAMLPIRRQYVPGVLLLVAAPVLMIWLGAVHGWLAGVAALAAVASMMRNPLRYLWRRVRGTHPKLPE
ncbi:DUF2484 family protein [Lutimaribacter sp. EGI FJ00015]|uniref:DUF2484 family protein n=1 Tax=Lutimaribacter degradans TaxID=2945989 RepID=A0ACC5ZRM8_9RHOB|nr:DUF2484 family protein [Lutimaribacter sp. EGI FJ00013]MCO0612370.1 DUF2484 family protein [Lutimaribacter sp. EGI FJ00015]MCO0634510.1 DUF2484 family protein [Lutimaribacter sp. EGI FJ00014]